MFRYCLAVAGLVTRREMELDGFDAELRELVVKVADLGVECTDSGIPLIISDLGVECTDSGNRLTISDLGVNVTDLGVNVTDLGVNVTDLGVEWTDPGDSSTISEVWSDNRSLQISKDKDIHAAEKRQFHNASWDQRNVLTKQNDAIHQVCYIRPGLGTGP